MENLNFTHWNHEASGLLILGFYLVLVGAFLWVVCTYAPHDKQDGQPPVS